MEIHLTPELQSRLDQVAAATGRNASDVVEDVMTEYLVELAATRAMLDVRYDEIKNGRVKPVDGETFFENLRQRERGLHKQRS